MLGHLCATVALLHLASLTGADILNVTVPDVSYNTKLIESQANIGEKLYISHKLTSIALACTVYSNTTNFTAPIIIWRRQDGAALSSGASASTTDVSTPLTAKSTLTINYPVNADFTTYVCNFNSTMNGTGSFSTRPLMTIKVNDIAEYDSTHWPGERVSLKCIVNGYPQGNIVWTTSTNSTFSYTGSELVLPSISYNTDRGYYTCSSANSIGTNSATVFLRVKDSQSYIAPLVSIFCEIVIMVLIVSAYEVYMMKRGRIADGDLKAE